MELQIGASWKKYLKGEFKKEYFLDLMKFIENEKKEDKVIYPLESDILNAFKKTTFQNLKVVIIGQDPYHGEGQAHGLCFSVQKGIKPPPSLRNIYKEMKTDLDLQPAPHGYLQPWAQQGVLMLNTVLTVEKSMPGSHRKKGWEIFTDKVISTVNKEKNNLVFILWGNDAKKKSSMLDHDKHLVLESSHPSPFSVKNFYGTRPFSRTNKYLSKHNIQKVNWSL